MSNQTKWLIGCGALIALPVAAMIGLVGWYGYMSLEDGKVAIRVTPPKTISTGQDFQLRLSIKNNKSSAAVHLKDIDFDEGLGGGFSFVAATPAPSSWKQYPSDRNVTLHYDMEIRPGEEMTFLLNMTAGDTAGQFTGDLDVWDGINPLTQTVSLNVVEGHASTDGASAGEDAPAQATDPVFVSVHIPEALDPEMREAKYGDPLNEALQEEGYGEVTGGGTLLTKAKPGKKQHIESIDLDVELTDLERGIPFLKKTLVALGAPKTSTLSFERNGKDVTDTLK